MPESETADRLPAGLVPAVVTVLLLLLLAGFEIISWRLLLRGLQSAPFWAALALTVAAAVIRAAGRDTSFAGTRTRVGRLWSALAAGLPLPLLLFALPALAWLVVLLTPELKASLGPLPTTAELRAAQLPAPAADSAWALVARWLPLLLLLVPSRLQLAERWSALARLNLAFLLFGGAALLWMVFLPATAPVAHRVWFGVELTSTAPRTGYLSLLAGWTLLAALAAWQVRSRWLLLVCSGGLLAAVAEVLAGQVYWVALLVPLPLALLAWWVAGWWQGLAPAAVDRSPAPTAGDGAPAAPAGTGSRWLLPILLLFFCSGMTGLVYEVAFERELALILGSTARASTTVLAVYMTGLALGAFFGGFFSDRVRRPLRYYALAEAVVGLLCLVAPWLFSLSNQLYLGLVRGQHFSPTTESVLHILTASVVVLLPALLMGTTMPLLARHTTRQLGALRRNIALLYSANTLGAAVGTLATAYVFIAHLGVHGTLRLATVVNFAVAGVALWLSRRADPAAPQAAATVSRPVPPLRWGGSFGLLLVVAAGVVGFISFALEVIWVHLLATVAGNSVYAFGLMLFSFLVGLGLGSLFISRWQVPDEHKPLRLCLSILLLGALVLLLLPLWDNVPPFFARYLDSPLTRTFAVREFIRFTACFAMMIGPTLLIGMIFPQLVDCSTSSVDALGRHVGLVSFSNTCGNITGAIVAGFLLIPGFGSFVSIRGLGIAALAVGLALTVGVPDWRRNAVLLAGGALAALLLWQLPGQWNLAALTLGSNVYFRPLGYGPPVELREQLDGGITTVSQNRSGGRRVTVLMTNGKFQGDDGREMNSQYKFSLYPLLYTPARERALLIGLGTGVSGSVFQRAGFRDIDIAELSSDLAFLSRKYFGHVNSHLLEQPNVHLILTDGRNHLQVTDRTYDVVSIEITSIWFAGAANLYNREFYQLVSKKLHKNGILQQWIQLHHISRADIASVIATVRVVFPHFKLYSNGGQGMILASHEPLNLSYPVLHQLEEAPGLVSIRQQLEGDSFLPMLGEHLLDTAAADELVRAVAIEERRPVASFLSTDDNRLLEYSTPRGNVTNYGPTIRANLKLVKRYRPPTFGRVPDAPAVVADLLEGARWLGAGEPKRARAALRRALESPDPWVAQLAGRLMPK